MSIKWNIHSYKDVESTNLLAKDFILKGAHEGTVILANKQSQGKGRLGRRWQSPEGNLYASLILKPLDYPNPPLPLHFGQMAFVISLGLFNTLYSLELNAPLRLKWPNDGVIHHKKLFGILIEAFEDAFIVGIGLNIEIAPHIEGKETTCLKNHLTKCPTRDDILDLILLHVEKTYHTWLLNGVENGYNTIKTQWLSHALYYNEIIIRQNLKGKFVDLTSEGALVIENENGSLQLITDVESLC